MAAIFCCTEQPKFFGVQLSSGEGQIFRPVAAGLGMGLIGDIIDLDPLIAGRRVMGGDQDLIAADAHVVDALGETGDLRHGDRRRRAR